MRQVARIMLTSLWLGDWVGLMVDLWVVLLVITQVNGVQFISVISNMAWVGICRRDNAPSAEPLSQSRMVSVFDLGVTAIWSSGCLLLCLLQNLP